MFDFWTKKINIRTHVLSEKIFLNEKTPHSHPLQVKWSVSNQIQIDELHAEDIFMIIFYLSIYGVDLKKVVDPSLKYITVRLDEAYLFRHWFIH